MRWSEVLADKTLQDLPFKIETNEYGQVVMSPAGSLHGYLQIQLGRVLETALGGYAISECAVQTNEGVKVADVAWMPAAFYREHGFPLVYSVAPPICVEVRSQSNSDAELREKIRLYVAAGAKEVWLVDHAAQVEYHSASGQLERSTFDVDVQLQLPER
jgi:Uma2 family endonuclease